jgi:hypothetical protein
MNQEHAGRIDCAIWLVTLAVALQAMKAAARTDRSRAEGTPIDGLGVLSGERFLPPSPWCAERPEHLAVCCSDGRWHEHVEEFLRAQVSARADLYAVPGGAAGFNLWSSSQEERAVADKALRFLAEHHQLRAVWLIAHQDCAYYRAKFSPLDSGYIARRQLHDLAQAADGIARRFPQLTTHQVYAARDRGRVVFTQLAPGSPAAPGIRRG